MPGLSRYLDGHVVKEHYSRRDVREEVIRFSRGRWLALAGSRWIRHLRSRPLTVESLRLPDSLLTTETRALYATTALYRRLRSRKDPYEEGNVVAVTPYLDIDNELEHWRATIEVARAISDELESMGVVRSVYILWSGKGAHVRVHEYALSRELRDLDHAWALAEYLRIKVEPRVAEIRRRLDAAGMGVRVENQLKPRSLFTVPLSLHRVIDRVAICLKPEDLDDFDLSWTEPFSFKHHAWEVYEVGEADGASKKALELVGGYPVAGRGAARGRRRKEPPVDEMVRKWNDI